MPAQPIALSDLTVAYDGRVALRNLNHVFQPGTSTAVMGANGSGKTTLLNVIAGLLRPTRGAISPVSKDLGYVMQHGQGGWMPITAGEVIEMGRYRRRGLLGRLDTTDRNAIAEAASRLDTTALLDRQFHELSGGQQQRVRVARALAGQPRTLLFDEPITGLDLLSQELILQVIADETAHGTTVVVTTHHLDEARHCNMVMLLATELVAAGAPDQVLRPDNLRAAFGDRILGDHRGHDHGHELLILDDHGHGHLSGDGHHHPGSDTGSSPT